MMMDVAQTALTLTDFALDMLPETRIELTPFDIELDLQEQIQDNKFFTFESGMQVSAMVLSAGFVTWAIRGAGLFASLLTSLPAWRHMDPLPVLNEAEKDKIKDWTLREDDDGHDVDEEAVADMLSSAGDARSGWLDKGATVLGSHGKDVIMPGSDSVMSFLEKVASPR